MYRIQAQIAAVHVIQQTAGGRNDDLRIALQRVQLLHNGLTAVQYRNAYLGNERRQFRQLFADLHRQLAGRAEHNLLNAAILQIHIFQHGNPKGAGFARARGGNGHDVHAAHHQGNRLGLHRGGLLEAHLVNGLEHFRADVHLVKSCDNFF